MRRENGYLGLYLFLWKSYVEFEFTLSITQIQVNFSNLNIVHLWFEIESWIKKVSIFQTLFLYAAEPSRSTVLLRFTHTKIKGKENHLSIHFRQFSTHFHCLLAIWTIKCDFGKNKNRFLHLPLSPIFYQKLKSSKLRILKFTKFFTLISIVLFLWSLCESMDDINLLKFKNQLNLVLRLCMIPLNSFRLVTCLLTTRSLLCSFLVSSHKTMLFV